MCPYSSAFSPDGKLLYLSGFNGFNTLNWGNRRLKSWLDGVTVLDYEGDAEPRVFVGGLTRNAGIHAGVACDNQGRVYVSDYVDNAVKVYTPDATLLKTIPIPNPTYLFIHPKTGELYVFSWYLGGPIWFTHPKLKQPKDMRKSAPMPPATLTVLKSFDDPKPVARFRLPFVKTGSWSSIKTSWGDARQG